MRRIARLLVGNRRLYYILVPLLLLALVSLERSRSTQKPLANPNYYLVVPSKHLLLAYSNLALVL